jgi:hypothetical protein
VAAHAEARGEAVCPRSDTAGVVPHLHSTIASVSGWNRKASKLYPISEAVSPWSDPAGVIPHVHIMFYV